MKKKIAPGIHLEKVIARIQQMMDPSSTVTHNEILEDRVGNKRQYDIVIRGQFGGKPVIGVIECKDHSRKKGPDAVEAFAKKTDNLGANLRIMISKKGFTTQALKLAKHEHIGCLSLLPEDPKQVGFSVGDMWYGVLRMWTNIRLIIHFAVAPAPVVTFDINTVKWRGKSVINWFVKELLTTYSAEAKEGDHTLKLMFDEQRNIEIEGSEYPVIGISCAATRVCQKKKMWVNWSGDALYDWHTGQMTIPAKGTVGSSVIEIEPGLPAWSNYDGEIPELGKGADPNLVRAVIYNDQRWDSSRDNEVPDISNL